MKKLLIILIIIFGSALSHAASEIFCIQEGDSWNSSNCGASCDDEATAGTCMSVSDFNTAGKWDLNEDTANNIIGPGDTVYAYGTISSNVTIAGSGTSGHQITIDGWEADSCNPYTDESCSSGALFTGLILLDKNYISWVDTRVVRATRALQVGQFAKVVGANISRNYFENTGGWTTLRIVFMCDSLVDNNYFLAPYTTNKRGFGMNNGSRNVITNNKTYGGMTGMIFLLAEEYATYNQAVQADPDANISYNEIAYNYVEYCVQEGISFDLNGTDTPADWSIREFDTVSAVNGTEVTLTDADWTGESDLYEGYYMVVITDADDVFGRSALITHQADKVFTLDSTIANLEVGDVVSIGHFFIRNWVHHNTVKNIGYGASAINFDESALENLVEINTAVHNESNPQMIKIMSLYNYVYISTNSYCADNFTVSGVFEDPCCTGYQTGNCVNITQTHGTGPSAFNVLRNNDMDSIRVFTYDKTYSNPAGSGYAVNTRNNAIYDNTLDYGVDATVGTYNYYDNNTLGISEDVCYPDCDRADDPTASLTGWPFVQDGVVYDYGKTSFR